AQPDRQRDEPVRADEHAGADRSVRLLRLHPGQPVTPRLPLWVALAAAACSKADDPPAPTPPAAVAPSTRAAPRPAPAAPAPAPRPLTAAARAGKLLFFDRTLSASGAMACATCHDPEHGYGPPNDLAVQLGGPRGASPGVRAVPALRYKEF